MARFGTHTERFKRGDTHRFQVTIRDSVTLTPIDITNHEPFRLVAKKSLSDADVDAVLNLTEPDNIARTTPLSGLLTVTILPANTLIAAVPFRRLTLYAEVYAKSAGGVIDRSQLTILIDPPVLRANP